MLMKKLLFTLVIFIPLLSAAQANKIYRQALRSSDLNEKIDSDDYIYVKDLLTLTKKDRESGESNNVYLDDSYMPNKIHKFYKINIHSPLSKVDEV